MQMNLSAVEEKTSNVMMVLGTDVAMIGPHDFPEDFVNMKHPQDYSMIHAPVTPQCIVHRAGIHARLIFRTSWKSGSTFVPMSFIVDTGSPFPFYFSAAGMAILRAHTLLVDDDNGNSIVAVNQADGTKWKAQYMDTPSAFEPANIIGLKFALRFPMAINGDSFAFEGVGPYF